MLNSPVFFRTAGDERVTPQDTFDRLHAEFQFDIDVAASPDNHKCDLYFGTGSDLGTDALEEDWGGLTCWLNPPYSCAGAFVKKAREEADKGATVVLLLPVRSDTKWWHEHIWDKSVPGEGSPQGYPDGHWRPGTRVRLLQGRLNFELRVPANLRAWIKSETAAGAEAKALSDVTGLPKMAIERICLDWADDTLMEGAPFPSCVVVFEKVEG